MKFFTLSASVLALALAGCIDEDTSQSTDSMLQKLEQSIMSATRVKNEEDDYTPHSILGSYLISNYAQNRSDWSTSSRELNRFIDVLSQTENASIPDAARQRALILSIGSGDFDTAFDLAKDIAKTEASALSELVRFVHFINKNDTEEAKKIITTLPQNALSDLLTPQLKEWLGVEQNSQTPQEKSSSASALYHSILIADFKKDKAALQKLIRPDIASLGFNTGALEDIGDIYVQNGLTDQAIILYQAALTDASNTEDVALKLNSIKNNEDINSELLFQNVKNTREGMSLAFTDIAALLFQERGYDSARIFAQLALELHPKQDEAHVLLGHMSAYVENYDDAIYHYASINPEDEETYIRIQRQIADIIEESGDTPRALKVLNEIVDKTNDVDTQIQIGDILRRQENYKDALKIYNKAFDMIGGPVPKDQYWSLYYSRGITYERLKELDKSEKDLQIALEQRPDNPFILNYLGYSWADQGKNLDKALSMIKKAVLLQPNDGYITDSLGWVYYRLERYEDALPYLERAVELLPYDPIINDHLGDVYWKLDRKKEARFQWRRALNAYDENQAEEKATTQQKIDNGLNGVEETKN